MLDELMPGSVVSDHKEKIPLLARGARTYLKQASLPREDVGIKDLIDLKILTYQGADAITKRQYGTLKHGDDLEYFERTTRNGYDLEADKVPRIVTIHGAKGRQAKSVVVFTEMGKKCWDDPDAENRLAYVAATRTQSDITICAENKVDWAASEYAYPIEGQ
jgi:superfamily I DNA/RNA helicase